jgi:hypothetical protein
MNQNFKVFDSSSSIYHIKPDFPYEYDMYYDINIQTAFIYYNGKWVRFSTSLSKKEERILKLKELGFDK